MGLSERDREALAEALADHAKTECGDGDEFCAECICGYLVPDDEDVPGWHRAHALSEVGEVVESIVRRAKAEAWDEGWGAGVDHACQLASEDNPYRAAQDVQEGAHGAGGGEVDRGDADGVQGAQEDPCANCLHGRTTRALACHCGCHGVRGGGA